MINLFNISNYTIDTSQFSNFLHDNIVDRFTENFCKYIGVLHGCPVNSASSAIFLLSLYKRITFNIPTMIPPVVLNAIINSAGKYVLMDDPDWVGGSYVMYDGPKYKIIDSAQEVKPNIQLSDKDIAIYSFYPTKPVGSCDGGMVVSNDYGIISFLKQATTNGTTKSENSWDRQTVFPGWKMYMNSVQAYIANENLKRLYEKKEKLKKVRDIYNNEFNLCNTSDHLYRIKIKYALGANIHFIKYMENNGITCGIHYQCAHKNIIYSHLMQSLPESEHLEQQTVSIPFHENLTDSEIQKVIQCVKSTGIMA